jgi:hypothetical protein
MKQNLTKDDIKFLLKDMVDKRVNRLLKISFESLLQGHPTTVKASRDIILATRDNILTEDELKRHFV